MIVTVEPDAFPPRVKIETLFVEVWRVEEDGSRYLVRGPKVDGAFYDYEAPQGRVVTYDEWLTQSSPVVMPSVGVWLIAPGRPELSVPLALERGAFSGWKRASDRAVTAVPGRAESVVVEFTRKAPAGTLKAVTLDADEADALYACLNVGGPMFLSFSADEWPAFGRVSWVSIGDVDDDPQFDLSGQQVWVTSFDVTPVARPEILVDSVNRIMDLVGTIGNLPGTISNRREF